MVALSRPIKQYALLLSIIWTLLVSCSFVWTSSQQKSSVIEVAKHEAQIAFQKDTLYRQWASKNGGVFVPVTPETLPNPYLPNTIERTASTPSGKLLTLVNPAYMTRQVFELATERKDLVQGHLTSLNPIRPENSPDQWEQAALTLFETGVKEVSEIKTIDGLPYLRLMRPFIVEQHCLKCHAAQGYKVDAIRGGLSVSVPLLLLSTNSNKIIAGEGIALGLIWLMGIGIIHFGTRKLLRVATALDDKTHQLENQIIVRKEMEATLKQRTQELEARSAELERFNYTVSHDLKSPLVTVKSFLGFLELDLVAANTVRIQADIDYIRAASNRMGLLLDELLEISQVGRVSTPAVEVSFLAIGQEVLALLAGSIAERGVTIHFDDAGVIFFGDRSRLVEIWQNLLENAVKYMGDQAQPSISFGCDKRGDEEVFFVRDNGIGLDPRYADKIFNLFEQLDKKFEGSGLGLALVKRIVELNNGRIWVESAGEGQGACFRFTLPGAIRQGVIR